MNVNLDENREILGGLARHARRLYVESDHFSVTEQLNGEMDPSFEVNSIVTSTRFAFDNEIIASRAYQRTLAYVRKLEIRQAEFDAHQPDALEASNDVRDLDQDSSSEHTERHSASSSRTEKNNADQEPIFHIPSGEVQLQTPQIQDVGLEHNNEHLNQIDPDLKNGLNTSEQNDLPIMEIDFQLDNLMLSPPWAEVSPPSLTDNINTANISIPSKARPADASAQHMTGDLLLDRTFNSLWTRALNLGTYQDGIRRKTVWVGDGCCGKTYALISGIKRCCPSENVPTVFENYLTFASLDGYDFELAIWDTAGFGEYDRLRPLSYPDSHVVVMCFNIANKDSLENVYETNIFEVQHFCENTPILLVGCQLDLRGDEKQARRWGRPSVTYEEGLEVAKKIGAVGYVECSAKSFEGLDLLFEAITKCCVLGDSPEWRDRSTKRRGSTLSLSKMFRRKSQIETVVGSEMKETVADPKFSMRIDYSWRNLPRS